MCVCVGGVDEVVPGTQRLPLRCAPALIPVPPAVCVAAQSRTRQPSLRCTISRLTDRPPLPTAPSNRLNNRLNNPVAEFALDHQPPWTPDAAEQALSKSMMYLGLFLKTFYLSLISTIPDRKSVV